MGCPLVIVLMPESAHPPATASSTAGIDDPNLRPCPKGRFQRTVVVLLNRWSYPESPFDAPKSSRLTDWRSPLPISSAPEALSIAFDQVNEFSR